MTRAHRRDKGTKNASIITGLRLEKDVAKALCEWARQIDGDVAALSRYFIYKGLGYSEDQAARAERELKPERLAGLALDSATNRRLIEYAQKLDGWNTSAAARHLLRLQLGYSVKDSTAREEKFALLAQAKRAAMESI